MNTMLNMVLIGLDETTSDMVEQRMRLQSQLLEKMLSRFDPEGETFQMNQVALDQWFPVSEGLWDILLECKSFHKLSLGYFDIGLGIFKQQMNQAFPKADGENSALRGINGVDFDRKGKRLRYGSRTISIDFGAIGKGLLLREIDLILTEFDIKNCLISFGGSSILTRGSHPYGHSWPVSLREAHDSSIVFDLNDHFASISGAVHGNGSEGKSHIVHPHSCRLVENNRITYVQRKCPVSAEVLSTSLVAAEREDFSKLISNLKPEKAFIYKRTETNELISEYEYESGK